MIMSLVIKVQFRVDYVEIVIGQLLLVVIVIIIKFIFLLIFCLIVVKKTQTNY